MGRYPLWGVQVRGHGALDAWMHAHLHRLTEDCLTTLTELSATTCYMTMSHNVRKVYTPSCRPQDECIAPDCMLL